MGNDLSNDNNHKQAELEISTFYDIYFNTLNLDNLKEQVSNILNNPHFMGWGFQGLRDEIELEILDFVFAAKKEVMSHKNHGKTIYENINIDTLRYATYLENNTRCSLIDNNYTLDDKIIKYNKMYPYIYNQIAPENKKFFAKLANYITFENEDYCISGYNVYDINSSYEYNVYSKKDVIKRHDLFKQMRKICEGEKINKNTRYFKGYMPGFHAFIAGYAISDSPEHEALCIKVIKEIVSSELFINWKFEGLKTDDEKYYELPNQDLLKPLGFSENSFFVLSYFINYILGLKSSSDRNLKKKQLLNKVLKLIPQSEINTFARVLDYFTNSTDDCLNVESELVDISVLINVKKYSFWESFNNTSNLLDISKSKLLEKIKKETKFMFLEEDKKTAYNLTEDNLFENIKTTQFFKINILPTNFSYIPIYRTKYKNYQDYIVETFKLISSLSLKEFNSQANQDVKNIKFEEIKIENNNDYNLFDLLSDLNNTEIEHVNNKQNSNNTKNTKISNVKINNIALDLDENGQLTFAI